MRAKVAAFCGVEPVYSQRVTDANLERLEASLGFKLVRFDVSRVADISQHLQSLQKSDGSGLRRVLTKEEASFIRNERIVSQLDFFYWAERYAVINLDGSVGGGVGRLQLWESQRMALAKIAEIEEKCVLAQSENLPVDGICVVYHKARQLGATMIARCLIMHRETLLPYMRCMSASIDEDKVQELYDRDKMIIDHLPWYLRPQIGFDVKGEHLYFDKLNSRILYQQAKQQSGLGQGRQFDLGHITEVAFFPYPQMIELDYFPAIPQGINTMHIFESTANGRGNWWQNFSDEVRKGYHRRWVYVFIPYYVNEKKYVAAPPPDWIPSELSMMHAKKVFETSREFVGKDVMLTKPQLYWYETEYASAMRRGSLNFFLTNFCATPSESFQHSNQSAFSTEVIQKLRLHTKSGTAYEVITKS